MNVQASIEQVAGILVREGLRFQTHEDGDSYRLLFGEDAVFIHFANWHRGVRIGLTSHALQEVPEDEAEAAITYAELGELNHRHHFVTWIFEDGTLTATHDCSAMTSRSPSS